MLPNSGLPKKMNKLHNEKKIFFWGFLKIYFMTSQEDGAPQQLKHPLHCFPWP